MHTCVHNNSEKSSDIIIYYKCLDVFPHFVVILITKTSVPFSFCKIYIMVHSTVKKWRTPINSSIIKLKTINYHRCVMTL